MLQPHICAFLDYCQLASFSARSRQALAIRLNELLAFLSARKLDALDQITYLHLAEFVGDFKRPSVHVKKSRVWTLRQFYHFLCLQNRVTENPAGRLPYPKIEKTVPAFLTQAKTDRLIRYFIDRVDEPFGIRNLLIVLLLATLGLRTSTVRMLDTGDVDLDARLLWVNEKGGRGRPSALPDTLCDILGAYLPGKNDGALLSSKRGKRIAARTIQDILKTAADSLGIKTDLHPRLLRHTAATHLNRAAGIEITQELLGHSMRKNTFKYTHLNPDCFASFMKQHPYNQETSCPN